MNLPPDFDRLAVTDVGMNALYFEHQTDIEIAQAALQETFPNAEIAWLQFMEDLGTGLIYILPIDLYDEPEKQVPTFASIRTSVENALPQGSHRGDPRLNEGNYEDGKYIGPDLESFSSQSDP